MNQCRLCGHVHAIVGRCDVGTCDCFFYTPEVWLCQCGVDGPGAYHARPEECAAALRADRDRLRDELARVSTLAFVEVAEAAKMAGDLPDDEMKR